MFLLLATALAAASGPAVKRTFRLTPAVREIRVEPADVPTILLLGSSTVTDQRREPGASWGQMLPILFRADIAVANHAEPGETLKSFLTGLRLDKVLSQARGRFRADPVRPTTTRRRRGRRPTPQRRPRSAG